MKIILGLIVAGVFIALLVWGVDSRVKNQCVNYGRNTGREVRFVVDWPNVCYVKTSSGWVDREEIRVQP